MISIQKVLFISSMFDDHSISIDLLITQHCELNSNVHPRFFMARTGFNRLNSGEGTKHGFKKWPQKVPCWKCLFAERLWPGFDTAAFGEFHVAASSVFFGI